MSKPATPGWPTAQPRCFSSLLQWQEWKRLARQSELRGDHCTDCTPEFQADMLRQGRCDRPDTAFARDADGFVCGFHPTPAQEAP